MKSRFFAGLAVVATLGIALSGGRATAADAAALHVPRAVQRLEPAVFRGMTAPTSLSAARPAGNPTGLETRPDLPGHRPIDVHPAARLRSSRFAAAAVAIPSGPNLPVVPADPDFFGFAGLTHFDQRNAGTGRYVNTQFSLEPPDQGLCVGNGYVVEAVNNALAVYSNFGTRLTAPTALSQFFGVTPEINRITGRRGEILSDPRCYFDRDTQRWFLTELEIDVDPLTGATTNHSAIYIAVSRSADPTAGYALFAYDTTDAANPGCPCLGDQPLIGADGNGFFVSTNEFSIAGTAFNGAQIYALSKRALTALRPATVVQIDAGSLPTPDIGATWYSIQPAAAPDTAGESRTKGGTEYLMSSLDFFNLNDNRIAVWAVTNTRSLTDRSPNIGLQHVVIGSVAYGLPPPSVQRSGAYPYGMSLHAPLEYIDSNDDRMSQVVYANGQLWSAVDTSIRSGGRIDAGIAYFALAPHFDADGFLTAQMSQQGYVAVGGQNLSYPSIGVNSSGGAVMAATLTGPNYYPTAVYVTQDGRVHVAGAGARPDDGFTGYGSSTVARWGDYSAAVAALDGSIWVAAEYIPLAPRTLLANWGTFVGHVQIHH